MRCGDRGARRGYLIFHETVTILGIARKANRVPSQGRPNGWERAGAQDKALMSEVSGRILAAAVERAKRAGGH